VQIAAAMMVVGFAFYGKNPLNVWFPVIGVLLQTALSKKPLNSATAAAWFSTALSPIFSVLAFGTPVLGEGSPLALALGAVFGIFGGVLVGVLVGYLPSLHKGYVLYNAGFAAGISGMIVNAIQKAVAIGHDKYPYVEVADAAGTPLDYVSGANGTLSLALVLLFAYFIVVGLVLGGGKNYTKLLKLRSKGGNFVQEYGFNRSLVNMGVLGLVSTLYVFATVKGHLSGPVFGCIWTVAGFAAAGVSLRMHLPLMAGVYVTAFLTGGITGLVGGGEFLSAALSKVGSRGMLLAGIFSAGLSPIVGEFGSWAGVLVGVIHCVLVPNTGVLHGWMSLYNNGLSLSLIATFFYTVYSKLPLPKPQKSEAVLEKEVLQA
jgi:hypothetical protein